MKLAMLVVLCACALFGCEGATWSRTEVHAPVVATGGERWSQYCTFQGSSDIEEINRFLRDQGDHGWQLVSVAGRNGTIYCFKTRVGDRSPDATPVSPMQTPTVAITPQTPLAE